MKISEKALESALRIDEIKAYSVTITALDMTILCALFRTPTKGDEAFKTYLKNLNL